MELLREGTIRDGPLPNSYKYRVPSMKPGTFSPTLLPYNTLRQLLYLYILIFRAMSLQV